MRDDRIGHVLLESLQAVKGGRYLVSIDALRPETWYHRSPHDLLLQRPSCDQTVHIDDLFLTEPVCPIHRLHILRGIPIVIHKDDRIRSRQGQSQSSHARREQQDIDARIRVEGLDNIVTFHRLRPTVQPHERYAGHVRDEEVILDDVQHLPGLAKDQDSVLRCRAQKLGFARLGLDLADTAISQQLSAKSMSV